MPNPAANRDAAQQCYVKASGLMAQPGNEADVERLLDKAARMDPDRYGAARALYAANRQAAAAAFSGSGPAETAPPSPGPAARPPAKPGTPTAPTPAAPQPASAPAPTPAPTPANAPGPAPAPAPAGPDGPRSRVRAGSRRSAPRSAQARARRAQRQAGGKKEDRRAERGRDGSGEGEAPEAAPREREEAEGPGLLHGCVVTTMFVSVFLLNWGIRASFFFGLAAPMVVFLGTTSHVLGLVLNGPSKDERAPDDEPPTSAGAGAEPGIEEGLPFRPAKPLEEVVPAPRRAVDLPASGDAAVERLLRCKAADLYHIVGVPLHSPPDVTKKHYRRQSLLVHPDKCHHPKAEDAFKMLSYAYDILSDEEKRAEYHQKLQFGGSKQEMVDDVMNAFMERCRREYEAMKTRLYCAGCDGFHDKYPVHPERPMHAARYCAQHRTWHPAKEGNVWAESRMLGMKVVFFACIDKKVWDVTEWASCQGLQRRMEVDSHLPQAQLSSEQPKKAKKRRGGGRSRGPASPPPDSPEAFFAAMEGLLREQAGAGAGASPATASPASARGTSKRKRKKGKRH